YRSITSGFFDGRQSHPPTNGIPRDQIVVHDPLECLQEVIGRVPDGFLLGVAPDRADVAPCRTGTVDGRSRDFSPVEMTFGAFVQPEPLDGLLQRDNLITDF